MHPPLNIMPERCLYTSMHQQLLQNPLPHNVNKPIANRCVIT
jgi:hypothetical protein